MDQKEKLDKDIKYIKTIIKTERKYAIKAVKDKTLKNKIKKLSNY